VPYGRESDWRKNRPRKVEFKKDKKKAMLQKCLVAHVNQYVLVMEVKKRCQIGQLSMHECPGVKNMELIKVWIMA
jgi:hypothetical protein